VAIPGTDVVADWSPDGKWLLTESDRRRANTPRYSMFVMQPDGSDERRITADGVHGYRARFSPNSRQIALYGGDKESRFVRIVDLDGTNERTILREGAAETPNGLCWSPDGRRLAIVMFDYKLTGDGKTLGTNFDEHDSASS
jgi:dipeptidyl aminopeptidase/acylaminoacyl peptidase